jgi:sugar phosphate permease
VGLMFSLSVFMEPLEQAFGWNREQIARANLYGWVVFGVCSFACGTLSDRFGTRWIVLCGGLLFGCGLLALSRMQTLWQLYLFHGGLIGGSIGAFMVPLTATVTRWFTHRRGLAVALVNCGTGLGGMLFAPLTPTCSRLRTGARRLSCTGCSPGWWLSPWHSSFVIARTRLGWSHTRGSLGLSQTLEILW